jgi:elongation factor Ts
MAITAAMVKELREVSGAGMMDAKKALTETDGDMEAAIDWLRTKGLAKAAKKSGRTAAEGLVGVKTEGGVGVAVEVNSETDFVAKNADFQGMVSSIVGAAVGVADLDALLITPVNGKPVSEVVTDAVAKIGENMNVRRMARVEGDSVAAYVHNAAAPGMGKIGVLVAMKGQDNGIGHQIAMHVAAANPASLSPDDLDQALVEREKAVLTEQARESGKPENIIENMIKGRMNKFYEEVTLLKQKFVINPDLTVADAAKEAGVEVLGFIRLEVGEGIEKKQEDFAAEVAKTMGA